MLDQSGRPAPGSCRGGRSAGTLDRRKRRSRGFAGTPGRAGEIAKLDLGTMPFLRVEAPRPQNAMASYQLLNHVAGLSSRLLPCRSNLGDGFAFSQYRPRMV
jgi:hypothetical protein